METPANWPLVDPNDEGVPTTGKTDECLFCQQKIGTPHGSECVVVTKRVKVRYSYDIEIDIPHYWGADEFLYSRLESSWCADSSLVELKEAARDQGGCLCEAFNCKFLEVTDDTPRRKIRGQKRKKKKPGEPERMKMWARWKEEVEARWKKETEEQK